MLDSFLEDFSVDQLSPFDTSSSSSASASPAITGSSLSSGSFHGTGQGKGSGPAGTLTSTGSNPNLTTVFLSPAAEQELKDLVARLRHIYREYDHLHGYDMDSRNRVGMSSNSSSSSGNIRNNSSVRDRERSTRADVEQCFREVPEVFFRPEFSLHIPEIFDQVLGSVTTHTSRRWKPQMEGRSRPDVRDVNDTSKQELLSRYLDLVEVALLKQIWSKSTAFFRALDDIKGLQARVPASHLSFIPLYN
jgi:hypothetical protein